MPRNYDIIVGIDPDVEKSGVAFLDVATKQCRVDVSTFADFVQTDLPFISFQQKDNQKRIVVVVEASWIVSGNWHLTHGDRKQKAAAKGYDVGRNHQVGKLIVELCRAYNIPVIEHIPLRKCWAGKDRKITHEELIQFCPVNLKRTNQEMRDAALLAWSFADLPIRLKVASKPKIQSKTPEKGGI